MKNTTIKTPQSIFSKLNQGLKNISTLKIIGTKNISPSIKVDKRKNLTITQPIPIKKTQTTLNQPWKNNILINATYSSNPKTNFIEYSKVGYLSNPIANRAISLIAKNAASVKLLTYAILSNGTKTEITNNINSLFSKSISGVAGECNF